MGVVDMVWWAWCSGCGGHGVMWCSGCGGHGVMWCSGCGSLLPGCHLSPHMGLHLGWVLYGLSLEDSH